MSGSAGEAAKGAGGKRAAPSGERGPVSYEAVGVDGTWAEVNLVAYGEDDKVFSASPPQSSPYLVYFRMPAS